MKYLNLVSFKYSILLIICFLGFAFHPALARTIQCGLTEKGQAIPCDLDTSMCYSCKRTSTPALELLKKQLKKGSVLGSIGAAYTASSPLSALLRNVEYEYKCIFGDSKPPKGCSAAPNGGGKSEKKTKFLIFTLSKEEGQHCIVYNFFAKYSYCYGCEVVETLSSAFVKAAGKAYAVSKQAGNAILIFGILLWLIFFALKNVSSFTSVEPMKMLQDLMVKCFKVIVAFVILNSGIETILHYTLVPIMSAGTDFADTIVNSTVINLQPSVDFDYSAMPGSSSTQGGSR